MNDIKEFIETLKNNRTVLFYSIVIFAAGVAVGAIG